MHAPQGRSAGPGGPGGVQAGRHPAPLTPKQPLNTLDIFADALISCCLLWLPVTFLPCSCPLVVTGPSLSTPPPIHNERNAPQNLPYQWGWTTSRAQPGGMQSRGGFAGVRCFFMIFAQAAGVALGSL